MDRQMVPSPDLFRVSGGGGGLQADLLLPEKEVKSCLLTESDVSMA